MTRKGGGGVDNTKCKKDHEWQTFQMGNLLTGSSPPATIPVSLAPASNYH